MTELTESFSLTLRRWQWPVLGAGGICLVVSIVVGLFWREQFFSAYLFSYLFVLGLALGSLALVMLHNLTGGQWGIPIRRPAEAAAMTLPLLALMFLPLLLGIQNLYPWAIGEVVANSKVLEHQKIYMNPQFFVLRALIYFVVWIGLAWAVCGASLRYDRAPTPRLARNIQRLSAAGLVLYMITISLASIDWIMSREAGFYSTIFGFILAIGEAATAMVFLIALLHVFGREQPLMNTITPQRLNDLGNLFMTLMILWAYVSFAQLLIIWMGNTKPEAVWYVRRGFGEDANFWRWVGLLLIIFHFFVPFLILLSREAKQRLDTITRLAAWVLLLRLIDNFWMASPHSPLSLPLDQPMGFSIRPLDFIMPVALFGIWSAGFVWSLGRRPLTFRSQDEEGSTSTTATESNGSGPVGGANATGLG